MANNLCGQSHAQHAPETHLPRNAPPWAKVRAMLERIDERPHCICSNCGIADYPDNMRIITVPCNGPADLRAWRVYQPAITALARELGLDVDNEGLPTSNEVFLCDPTDPTDDGRPQRKVFSCATCTVDWRRDVSRYDMFDGHITNADGSWTYESIGVGEPLPAVLACLSMEERLSLSLIKMADASYTSYNAHRCSHVSRRTPNPNPNPNLNPN